MFSDPARILYVDGDGFAGGNDTQKVLRLMRNTPMPKGCHIEVTIRHDDWCPRLQGRGKCACRPDVVLTPIEVPS